MNLKVNTMIHQNEGAYTRINKITNHCKNTTEGFPLVLIHK